MAAPRGILRKRYIVSMALYSDTSDISPRLAGTIVANIASSCSVRDALPDWKRVSSQSLCAWTMGAVRLGIRQHTLPCVLSYTTINVRVCDN